jgi:hypothetical protein
MAIDLESYLQQYAPPPDNSQDWRAQLMTLGLGLMGARKGEEFDRFGKAGLLAMGVGENLKKDRMVEHRQRMQDVAAMWKIAKDQEAMDRKAKLFEDLRARAAGGQPGAAPAGGGLPPGMPPGMPGPSGSPAGAPPGAPGMSAPPMPAGPAGGPMRPVSAPSMPMPSGTPAMPGPFPGGAGPQLDPLAVAFAADGEGDVGKILQDTANKQAEWGAVKVSGDTIYTQGAGVIGRILPNGRGYEINGQFVPASPAFLAALKAHDEEALERAIRKDKSVASHNATLKPFVDPRTGEVTNEAAAAAGRAGITPAKQIAENEASKAGAEAEKQYREEAMRMVAYADSMQSLRMSDPGKAYSGGASDFRMGLDNLFSVIPGLREFVDKNKLSTAQAFEAQYKTIILNLVSPMLKGQTSDRDVRIMLSSGPGLFMTPEGRQVFYDLIENRAERAQRIADAASAHMEREGNMRRFDARKVAGEIKGVISPRGRSLGAAEQAELRKMIDAAASGDPKAREAMKNAVQLGWVLY